MNRKEALAAACSPSAVGRLSFFVMSEVRFDEEWEATKDDQGTAKDISGTRNQGGSRKPLSLFSGCGGMDIGFEGGFRCLKRSINGAQHPDWAAEDMGEWAVAAPTAFTTAFANDIRPCAKAAWVLYFKDRKPEAGSVYHLGSIVDLVKQEKEGAGIFPKGIDIVSGGFPCQDFSVSGKRLGFHSEKSHLGTRLAADEPTQESRGKLYMWMREVVSLTRPKMFVAENMKGLANLWDVKEIIEHDFADAVGGGYIVVPAKILYASDYGVPQSRERIIFFGFSKAALTPEAYTALTSPEVPQAYDPYPKRTHGNGTGCPPVSCAEILSGLKEPEDSSDPSQRAYSKAKYLGSRCQGQSEIRLDGAAPTIRSEHHGNIEYRRLGREHGGRHEEELSAGFTERRLTVRECSRIQTFPDDYQFILPKNGEHAAVPASKAYKIIGNAVPCILAYNIAKNLEEKWPLYFG